MQKRVIRIVAVSSALLILFGCEREGLFDVAIPEGTFDRIQGEIFDVNCALSGCHAGSFVQAGLDLSVGRSYDNLVGVQALSNSSLLRVDPGNPDDSFLVVKLEGGPADKFAGLRMPLGRPPLAQSQVDMIRDWIADGALRD